MDLFGKRSAVKIKALERVIEVQRKAITDLESSELCLIADIREMDTEIFQMSQCDSWERMRPYFNNLQVWMEARRGKESNRIADVLIPEMKKAYR